MFFEGSEKKAKLIIDNSEISLLNDFNDDFWAELVSKCHAKILSSISNQHCKAYLLSESSLFVWDDHFVILTCGETSLVNAVEFFIRHIDNAHLIQLIFQRKNEYLAHVQPSCFLDDVKLLEQQVKGSAFRFGALDSHHTYLYHLNKSHSAAKNDRAYELLAYQICNQASNILCTPGLDSLQIRQFLRLEQLIPDFKLDDFVFNPFGYSLNAVKDNYYLTIHVTPQESSSYVSFDSNLNLLQIAPVILDILAPASFDLICFNEPEFSALNQQYIPDSYISKELVEDRLNCGYLVSFANYIRPQQQFTRSSPIDIASGNYTL